MQQPRFYFTGDLALPKQDAKMPFFNQFEKDGRKMARLNFAVKESDSNREFVEMFGGENDTIRTFDKDGNKIEIDWDDRFDKDVIDNVASYRKYVVKLGDERKEFITQYDAILYLHDELPNYNGRVMVSGQLRRESYNGTWYNHFEISNVFAAKESVPNSLNLYVEMAYNHDSADTADWKSEKKVYLDAYFPQYIRAESKTMYVPQRFVFDGSKYDLTDEKDRNVVEYLKQFIVVPNKKMIRFRWLCRILNGADVVEFDESCLTDLQKYEISLGISTIEEFKEKGQIYGDRVMEIRLVKPDLSVEDYKNGIVDMEVSFAEFEEEIYTPVKDEKLDDVMPKPKTEEKKSDIDDEDLFG